MSRISDLRKQEILDAAVRCFSKQGFHQTSIDDICRAVEMSPGSVYRYFRSKNDIIQAMVEAEQEQSIQLIHSISEQEDLVTGLKHIIKQALTTLNNPRRHALNAEITAEAFRNKAVAKMVDQSFEVTVAALAEAIRQEQSKNTIDTTLHPVLTAELIIALFDGLWWRQAIRPDTSPTRHAKSLTQIIERLLQPVKKPAKRK